MQLTIRSACLLVLCAGSPVAQELLHLKGSRRPVRGSVTRRTDQDVTFNPFYSTHAEMVWRVEQHPATKVKSVRSDVPAHEEFWVRLAASRGSADALCELAGFCKKKRLKQQRLLALEAALRVDADHAPALADYTQFAAKAFLRRDPVANTGLRAELQAWLKIDDATIRGGKAKSIIESYRLGWNAAYFARAYRSSQQPRGVTRDRKITLRGNAVKGVYTLSVPDSYDPFAPAPLLVVLHGGGRGGKDGKKVIGSGPSALTLYATELRGRGYIVVCPTAQEAPWAARPNDALIRALLDEVEILFNIDLNRVYLAGHSMGGYGTWHFGPKYCERFAAIAPASGGGSNGLKRLRDTRTFVHLYHGGDDGVVGPGNSRSTALRMLKDDNDFVYTELPGTGHGLPDSVVAEMFRFFARKRLTIKRRLQVRPRSSFFRKESREEIKFFGRLLPKAGAAASTRSLIDALAAGGGAGERAAVGLAKLNDKTLVSKLVKVLGRKKTTADGRALAARVLGSLAVAKALPALAKAAGAHDLQLVHEAIGAIARIDDPRRDDMILAAIESLCGFFQSRLSGKHMHYSDWNDILPEVTAALQLLSGFSARDKGARLHASVVQKILLADVTVRYSRRIRQDPDSARLPLLRRTRELLRACDDAAAKQSLAALRGRYGAGR